MGNVAVVFVYSGGAPAAAWLYFRLIGIVTGGEYNSNVGCVPYSLQPCDHTRTQKNACGKDASPTPPCVKSCEASYTANSYSSDKHKASSNFRVTGGVAGIQSEIMARGPVQGTLTVYADFPSYKVSAG